MKKGFTILLSILIIVQSSSFLSVSTYAEGNNDNSESIQYNNSIDSQKSNEDLNETEEETYISLSTDKEALFGTKDSFSVKEIKFIAKFNNYMWREFFGNECDWTFDNPDVAQFVNGDVQILKKGVTTAIVTVGNVSTKLMLFTRENVREQYVLYEQNFDSISNNEIPNGWKMKEGSLSNIGVKDGAFEIAAREISNKKVSVLLPDYLSMFGNYMIEADVSNLDFDNNTTSDSLMFRIQNNTYNKMVVRNNASGNGSHHYKIKTNENKIEQWIDSDLVLEKSTSDKYKTGGIGFQANGGIMRIDNTKISLIEATTEQAENHGENFARINEVQTQIALAPSIITEVNNVDDFNDIVSQKNVATAILTINKDLEVIGSSSGNVIGTLSSLYDSIKSNIIPAFRVNDSETVNQLVEYLKYNSIEDCFVISKKPEIVKQAVESYKFIRGIVDFDNVFWQGDINELMSIINTTNRSMTRIAVLPSEAATKSNVEFLRKRFITVWLKDSDDSLMDSDKQMVTIHKMITAGADGIVTSVPEKVGQALSIYNNNTTLIRKPFVIGHRGVPDIAPENTIEGSDLAFQLGADAVECDVHLTKPGTDGKSHLAIMHDYRIDRTSDGTGRINEKTYDELKTYYLNKEFPNEYPFVKIPTLRDYFERYTGKNQFIFGEIKGSNPDIIDNYIGLVRENGIYSNLATICGNESYLKKIKLKLPEMSLGYIGKVDMEENDVYGKLRKAVLKSQTLNSAFMPEYNGVDKAFLEASRHRGINVWSWTFTDKDTITRYIKMGLCGLTTNCTQVFSDWIAEINPIQSDITLNTDEMQYVDAVVRTYKGDVKYVVPQVVLISGGDSIRVEGNEITAVKEGEAYILLRYTASFEEGNTYDIFTQPVKIKVNN